MSAILSPCGTYRYELRRSFAGSKDDLSTPLVFCMLNPSTADATTDDATIRRCCAFARRERRLRLIVVNLYGLRSRRSGALWTHPDPIGPDNDKHLGRAASAGGGQVVVAWGVLPSRSRARVVASMLIRQSGAELYCQGTTKDGSPRHPLYVAADQPLVPWKGYDE